MTAPPDKLPDEATPMPNGQALCVADRVATQELRMALRRIGYGASTVADPYEAMQELIRRPLAFRALVLSLSAIYPEELQIIETVKRRFEHVEVIIADASGRSSALKQAIRCGADALLGTEKLLRFSSSAGTADGTTPSPSQVEAVLSPEELRAILANAADGNLGK